MKYRTIKPSTLPSSRSIEMSESYSRQILKSSAFTTDSQSFDIFLSHSFVDKDLIARFAKLLTNSGKTVYVDWLIDQVRDKNTISGENAKTIKKRMKQCRKMIYVHTPNAAVSRWCPWEVGSFDGMNKEVLVALISETNEDTTGQEYLDIYDRFFFEGSSYMPIFKKENDITYRDANI